MKNKKKNGKLALQLTIAIGVTFIILSLVQSIISIETMRKRVTELNTTRYVEIAENYAEIINESKNEIMARLDYYVYADIMQTNDTEAIVEWLRTTTKNRYEKIDYVAYVEASTGDFYADTGSKTNVKERDYYKAIILEGKDSFIDNPVTSKTTGKTVIHLNRAIKVDGKTTGFICGVINVEHFDTILSSIQISDKEGCAYIIAVNSQMLAFKGNKKALGTDIDEKTMRASSANIDRVLNGVIKNQCDYFWSNDAKTGKVLTVFEPIKDTTWAITLVLYENLITSLSQDLASLMTICFLITGTLIVLLIYAIGSVAIKPLKVVDRAMNEIATGNADLTKRINLKANNEVGRVVESFNQFSEKMQVIISAMKTSKDTLVSSGDNLKQSTEDTASAITEIISNIESMGNNINHQTTSVSGTASAVKQIASSIDALNSMIENQSSAVTQASSAVEEMIGNIESVSKSVEKMSGQFKVLEQESTSGLQKQDELSRCIEAIEDESEALQEANNVISSIAEQTNLLAMNAAIEAAHAGEAGKGFSVVADEIRKLSETSSSESKTIGDELRKIIDGIQAMVKATDEARRSFSVVSNGINQTNDLVQEIHNSMDEQSEGSKQISAALHNMNDTTTEVQDASLEMANGNQMILNEIKQLQDSTASMKQGMDEMAVGATQINRTGSTLSSISADMEDSIAQIGEQVDQFKV